MSHSLIFFSPSSPRRPLTISIYAPPLARPSDNRLVGQIRTREGRRAANCSKKNIEPDEPGRSSDGRGESYRDTVVSRPWKEGESRDPARGWPHRSLCLDIMRKGQWCGLPTPWTLVSLATIRPCGSNVFFSSLFFYFYSDAAR